MSDAKRNREYDAKRDGEHHGVMRGAVLTRCTIRYLHSRQEQNVVHRSSKIFDGTTTRYDCC